MPAVNRPRSTNLQAALLAVASLFVLNRLPACNSQTYRLIPTRLTPDDPLTRNTLQLQCRNQDALATLSFEEAMYWVDNTDRNLRDLLRDAQQIQTPVPIGPALQFTITRELEGRYFCGPNIGQTSPMQLLIAYPLISEVPTARTVPVQEEMTATLHPLISPGALLERYFIDWYVQRNGTLETLAQIQGPRSQPAIVNERYSVDPDSFALTIQSVQFEDRSLYHGVLGVQDPGGSIFMYERLVVIGVTLDVYVPPTFLESPTNEVVSIVEPQPQANFTCRVRAYPRPTITWYHEEEQISDSDKYMISETDSMEDDMFVVWSMVVVSDPETEDSGRIRCVGTISVQEVEQQPPAAESTAYLSVLGNVEQIRTFITLQSGAIFRLNLFRPMEAEVQLYIQYTDVESGNKTNDTTLSRYAQSNEITFFIENIPESYRMFMIDVALISGDLQGPLQEGNTVHDLTTPTELSETLIIYLVPCIFALLVLITIAIMAVTIVCVRFCSINCAHCCYSASRRTEKNDFLDNKGAASLDEQERVKNENDDLKRQNSELLDQVTELRCDITGIREDNKRLSEENARLWEQLKKQSNPGETPPLIRRPSGISGGPSWPGSVTEKDAVQPILEDHQCETIEQGPPTTIAEPPRNCENPSSTAMPDDRRGAPPYPGNREDPGETTPPKKRSLLGLCCARETKEDRRAREKFNNIRSFYATSMSGQSISVDGQTRASGSMVAENGRSVANEQTANGDDSVVVRRQAASELGQPPTYPNVVRCSYTQIDLDYNNVSKN